MARTTVVITVLIVIATFFDTIEELRSQNIDVNADGKIETHETKNLP